MNLNTIITSHTPKFVGVTASRLLFLLEPLFLIFMVYAFWYPIEIRYQWLGVLICVPIFMVMRLLAYGRLFTRFPLDIAFVLFIGLALLNLYVSPFTSANPMSRLYLLGRPLLGMALCVYFVEYARLYRKLDGLLVATLLLALLIGGMALLSSNWDSKGEQLRFIRDLLPRFANFPGASGGFNVNEIAGGLTWVVPLCAGFILWRGTGVMDRVIRWGFTIAFILAFGALYLGQSRFAIAGVLVALVPMIYFLTPSWRWRTVAWVVVVVFAALEVMIVRNVFTPAGLPNLAARDEESVNGRYDIWSSALYIVHDYPLTGVGMNMFRDQAVRKKYPAPGYLKPVLPHAHNEFLQVATDLGLPGLALFIGLYGVAFYTLARSYELGGNNLKIAAVSIAGGLLAHILFGMGDAIALWDRLAFLLWWLFALASALYWVADHNPKPLLET